MGVDLEGWSVQLKAKSEGISAHVVFETSDAKIEKRVAIPAERAHTIEEVCSFVAQQFGVCDHTEWNPYFLISSEARIINSIEDMRQQRREILFFKQGVDTAKELVGSLVMSIKSESKTITQADLEHLIQAIRANSWMAIELLNIGVLALLLQVMMDEFQKWGEKTVCFELCVAALIELFKCDDIEDVIESTQDMLFTPSFFRILLQVALQEHKLISEGCPTLLLLLYMLYIFPEECVQGIFVVLTGIDGQTPLFPLLTDPLGGDDVFATLSASSVLSAIIVAVDDDEELSDKFNEELQKYCDSSVLDEFLDYAGQLENFVEQLLLLSLSQSSLLVEKSATKDRVEWLEQHVKQLEADKALLRGELRRRDKAMAKMVSFMSCDSFPPVVNALPDIVRFGWDGVQWEQNYTLLHLAAECCHDPGLVELLALLATDMDARDDFGFRPIDYARDRNKNVGVEKVLERLRREEKLRMSLECDLRGGENRPTSVSSAKELKRQVALMKHLPIPLQRALDVCINMDTDKIEWPYNFTAMHLAAKCGQKEVVQMLLSLGASLDSPDDWGRTPLDYAIMEGHKDIAGILDHAKKENRCSAEKQTVNRKLTSKHLSSRSQSFRTLPSRQYRATSVMTADKQAIISTLRPELQKAIEAVTAKTWNKIRWPHDFSALHLAARLDSTDAIYLLVEASAWPGVFSKDDKGLLPIDYARMKKNTDAESLLSSLMSTKPSTAVGDLIIQVDVPELSFLKDRMEENMDIVELGLGDLRRELCKLRKDRELLVAEGLKGNKGAVMGGLLDEESFVRYLSQLETFGRQAVMGKLMDSKLVGGNSLNELDATLAMEQLELLMRIVQRVGVGAPSKGKGGKAGPVAPLTSIGGKSGRPLESQSLGGDNGTLVGKAGKHSSPPLAPPSPGKGGVPPPPVKGGAPPLPGKGGSHSPTEKGAPPPPQKGGKGDGKGCKSAGKDEGPTRDKCLVMSAVKCNRINWKKYNFGSAGFALKEQKHLSVWCNVADMIELIDKKLIESTFAALVAKDLSGLKPQNLQDVKIPDIITVSSRDQAVDSAFKSYVKKLPSVEKLCAGIYELDELTVTSDHMDFLINNFKLKPAWMKELAELKSKHPTVPLGEQESYIWGLGSIPGYDKRLMVWSFLRSFDEDLTLSWKFLEDSKMLIDCFRNSKILPEVLGFFLAIGNFMNSHYPNQSQADGFRIYDLDTAFKTPKDKTGKTVRTYAIEMFLRTFPDRITLLLEELTPLWNKVMRSCVKLDSSETISRKLFGGIDDCQETLKSFKETLANSEVASTELLSYIEDPADPFRLSAPSKLRQAKEGVLKLEQYFRDTLNSYEELLKFYGMGKDSAALDTLKEDPKLEKFVTFWDELLIQDDILLKKPARQRREYFDRMFLKPHIPDLTNLQCLYNLIDVEKQLAEERARSRRKAIAGDQGRRKSRRATTKRSTVVRKTLKT